MPQLPHNLHSRPKIPMCARATDKPAERSRDLQLHYSAEPQFHH
uniref:Uncharacterized protein n=1 Tax=Anguilla anguilla TaxID=7936 RepID=A0A0E9VIR6_ANGAN